MAYLRVGLRLTLADLAKTKGNLLGQEPLKRAIVGMDGALDTVGDGASSGE